MFVCAREELLCGDKFFKMDKNQPNTMRL